MERRAFLHGATLSLTYAFIGSESLSATDEGWKAHRDTLLAGRVPTEGGISVDLPETVENGAQVPFAVRVDNPMTAADHVRSIHLIATRNPAPDIGTFHLTPSLPRAEVFTRIRLAEGQDVLVLAELSDGRVLSRAVRITVELGGCVG